MFVLREMAGILAALLATLKHRNEIEKRLMSALADLQSAVAGLTSGVSILTTSVDAAVAAIKPATGTSDADLQPVIANVVTLSANVSGQSKRLNDAVAALTPSATP